MGCSVSKGKYLSDASYKADPIIGGFLHSGLPDIDASKGQGQEAIAHSGVWKFRA